MKNTKKLLSLLLALVMVIGIMPMTALAEGDEPAEEPVVAAEEVVEENESEDEDYYDYRGIFSETETLYSITLSSVPAMTVGQSASITATFNPADYADKGLFWTSSNEGVAMVDPNGKVTAISNGTAVITATSSADERVSGTTKITVGAPASEETYQLTVNNGTGGGKYKANTNVTIKANVPTGKVFDRWEVVEGGIAAPTTSEATITMPAKAVVLTAHFKDTVVTPDPQPTKYQLTVYNGSGSGSYEKGTKVVIKANVPANMLFDRWVVEAGGIATPTTSEATITMPANGVIITAKFKYKTVDPTPGRPVIYSATVYSDRVKGTATPNSKVQLYRDGSALSGKYVYADNKGNFEIKHDFEYYYRYYDYRYDDYRYYDYRYDSYRYYDKYNNKYYDRYYNYYRYSLIATKDGLSSSEYNLNDYYWGGGGWTGTYDPVYNKYPIIRYATSGSTTVTGYGVNGYDTVTVRDNLGYNLGSAEADSRGEFKVYLNRALRQGEKLKITASRKNYYDRTTDYTVDGTPFVPETGLYTQFTIGSKVYTRLVKGVTVTATMDVEPFIQNGRTMLPLRYVAESLGYTVSWNDATRVATFVKGSSVITVSIDTPVFKINGVEHRFSTTPITVNGRIMLSVSELGMALGLTHSDVYGSNANIVWNAGAQTVTIKK